MDSENKQRISLYLDKETVRNVDAAMQKYGFRSRNDFFEAAAENLIAADKLLADNGGAVSEKLVIALARVAQDSNLTIAKSMFRFAVQLDMVMRILVQRSDVSETEVLEMRREAINNVRRTRGKVRLEDIAAGYYNE